jgi:hypothetical protein
MTGELTNQTISREDWDALEWTCGHAGGAVCAECHRQLILRANELAAENLRLLAENEQLRGDRQGGVRNQASIFRQLPELEPFDPDAIHDMRKAGPG